MNFHDVFEIKGVPVTVRREDKRFTSPLPPHGKMGVLDMLCKKAKADGYKMIGCFGSKYSNWIIGLPYIANRYGLKSIICYPAKTLKACPPWLIHTVHNSRVKGFQLHLLHPNMVTINQSQAKSHVEKRGGFFIPFGFDMPEVVNALWEQFFGMPKELGTIVLSCGSGITLSGILRTIRMGNHDVKKIIGISSGRAIKSILATVSKYEKVPSYLKLYQPYEYAEVPEIECPWAAHDHFELKAYDWMYKNIKRLREPIYFVNIGANS